MRNIVSYVLLIFQLYTFSPPKKNMAHNNQIVKLIQIIFKVWFLLNFLTVVNISYILMMTLKIVKLIYLVMSHHGLKFTRYFVSMENEIGHGKNQGV